MLGLGFNIYWCVKRRNTAIVKAIFRYFGLLLVETRFLHENFTVDGFFNAASDGATCSSHAATKSCLKPNVNKNIIKIYMKNYQNSYEKLMYGLKKHGFSYRNMFWDF